MIFANSFTKLSNSYSFKIDSNLFTTKFLNSSLVTAASALVSNNASNSLVILVLISLASEDFDGLNDETNPNAVVAKKANARCKNQISFCSKFIHFCCPNIVFIIDQYSLDGGKKLIPQKQLSYKPKFEKLSNTFEELDFVNLLSEYKETLVAVKRVLADQKNISFLTESISKEDEKTSSYIEHCVRAYCISQFLHNQQIENVTPRLIDDLFLRIKK